MNKPVTDEAGEALDYFELETRWGSWSISTEMARHVETAIDADPPAPWVTFVDIVGARVRLRTEAIVAVTQSTTEQRAQARARYRRLKREREAEGTWDD